MEAWQRVQGLLQRGHTVDRLTDADLQDVARTIEKMQNARASAPACAAASSHGQDACEQSKNHGKDDDEQGSGMQADKKPDPETKEERKKRLHRRNMRYYRSLASCSPGNSVL